MTIVMCTASGEQHGLINYLPNSVPNHDFKHMTPENASKCRKEVKKRAEIVRGRYINHIYPTERLEKSYINGPGEPICQYKLIPGYEYDLPRGFVEEVNGNPGLPQREGLQEVDGKAVNQDATPLRTDKAQKYHEIVPCKF